jgi:hypothetical protein
LGEIERGKSLEVADDSFGHVPGLEQSLVGQCHGQRLHVFAHARRQRQSLPQQPVRELFADIALSPNSFLVSPCTSAMTGETSLTLPGVSLNVKHRLGELAA